MAMEMPKILGAVGGAAVVPVEAVPDDSGSDAIFAPTTSECAWELMRVAAPNVASFFLYYVFSFATFGVVGRLLGAESMAAASIGYFVMSFSSLAPGMCMNYAVDTLCSQAYGRDPDSQKQGRICQRAMVISTIFAMPLSIFLMNATPLLHLLYPGDSVAHVAQWLYYCPLLFLTQLLVACLNKFLANQFKQTRVTVAMGVAGVLSIPLAYKFVPIFGVAGSSVAMGVASTAQLVVLCLLIAYDTEARHRFGPFCSLSEIFERRGVMVYLKHAVPSLIFGAAEASCFDVTVIIAGVFSELDAAAWSSILTMTLYSQSVSGGLSMAAAATVGQAIGSGKPELARKYAALAPALAGAYACVASWVMLTYHEAIFSALTDDGAVAHLVTKCLWIVPLLHVGDCVQYVFQGIFSGCGRNRSGAAVLVGALWCVGVPLCYVLGKDYGVVGVIGGLTIGLWIEIPLLIAVSACTFDWTAVDEEDEDDDDDDDDDTTQTADTREA